MTENEFEVEGVTYVAQETVEEDRCDGCDFLDSNCWDDKGIPSCSSDVRVDGRDVIFVAKVEVE